MIRSLSVTVCLALVSVACSEAAEQSTNPTGSTQGGSGGASGGLVPSGSGI